MKKLYLIALGFLASLFLFAGFVLMAHPASIEVPKAETTEPNVGVATAPAPTASEQVKAACELIYKGEFDAAGKLIGKSDKNTQPQSAIGGLAEIVQRYKDIRRRSDAAKEAALAEQLAELEKLKAKEDSNDITDVNNAIQTTDINDVNDIPSILLVVTKACEFVTGEQKDELLSKPFVKQTIHKAIDKAAQYESQGKWLDAYITCYSWLQAIEPNNQVYDHHADQLYQKANIVASLQDSACETVKERFEGVKNDIFIRAVAFLRLNYINIIDYRQMATNAIQRCQLLGEVVRLSHSDLSEGLNAVSASDCSGVSQAAHKDSFSPPDSQKLSSWSAGLAEILDEFNQSPIGFGSGEFIDVFEKVLVLNAATVNLPHPVLIAQFVEAALSALDPYTVIIWPRQVQDFEKMMTNEFTGIGVEITKEKGLLTVASLLPDTPAYSSGLDAGDVIEKVDGVETKDMPLTCAVRKITGPEGTQVTLTTKHPGKEKTEDIVITRAKITVPTIRGWQRTTEGKWRYMIDQTNKIGYVRITPGFSDKTADDLENVLDELEAEGLRGLILDLRFNTGGLLDSAVAVADKFLDEGLIVRTQPKGDRVPKWIPAHKENTHPNYPLVVLINSRSASASEIVAGALADKAHNRAILVGTRTHGKGSVQGITPYPGDGAQLKYTMAYYHLPSGQRVESQDEMEKLKRTDWGVGPNIEVKLRSDELRKMIDVQRDNDVLIRADRGKDHNELKKYTVEETLEADPQLAVGVLAVRTKLIEADFLTAAQWHGHLGRDFTDCKPVPQGRFENR